MVPRINRNNEVENTGYMLNELMKAKVNRLRLSVRSYINPTEQNKPLELKPWASEGRVILNLVSIWMNRVSLTIRATYSDQPWFNCIDIAESATARFIWVMDE